MNDRADREWVSLHLFHAGDLDRLLVECLHPLASRMRDRGAIADFFYLRYWNGGPHIRLRLLASPADAPGVSDAVGAEFRTYSGEHPGPPVSPDDHLGPSEWLHAIERAAARRGFRAPEPVEPVQAAGTWQKRDYVYDFSRYGHGVRGEVEHHFCRSSELALFILGRTVGRPGVRRAIGLHLSAAAYTALGMTPQEGRDVFSRLSTASALLTPTPHATGPPGRPASRDDGEDLDDLHNQLRNGLPVPTLDERVNSLLLAWQNELEEQLSALTGASRTGGLDPRHVILDYVHLLNNRLGLGVDQECELYRLIAKAAEFL